MTTHPYYEYILQTLPLGLERQVLKVLQSHIGQANRISLADIARLTLGKANATTDRQVREAIEALRRSGIPVLSESGRAGRWLAASESERQSCLAEFRARRANLDKTIKALEHAKIPVGSKFPDHSQLTFFGPAIDH